MTQKAYAQAGVDISLAERLLNSVKNDLKSASRPEVIGGIGGFGGVFDLSKMKHKKPALVSSTDSVGTKVVVANLADKHGGLGADIVNHCCNDVAVVGAEPIFFLDYFAAPKLPEKAYVQVLKGLSKACREGNVALIGGETAELPGVYQAGEYDLVGTIVGICDRDKLIDGKTIRSGDVLIGVASSGLHTNGYTLARKVFFEKLGLKVTDNLPDSKVKVGDALLKPHTNYAPALNVLYKAFNQGKTNRQRKGNAIFGIAHITGGGFVGNIPRVLPENVDVEIDTNAWPKIPVFKALAAYGEIPADELYEVFNMGIGLVMAVDRNQAESIQARLSALGHKNWVIGNVVSGSKNVKLI
jgi:phosphoribosylformylglycinamidine cyclo-ligase